MTSKNIPHKTGELEPDLSLADLESFNKPEIKETITDREKEKKNFGGKESFEKLQKINLPAKAPIDDQGFIAQDESKTQFLLEIENILEDDLSDVYFKMDEDLQKKFKIKGETTAAKIEKILTKTKVNSSKIFKLIFEWLKLIPKVSTFFLKQEAKIKTDKILKLKP